MSSERSTHRLAVAAGGVMVAVALSACGGTGVGAAPRPSVTQSVVAAHNDADIRFAVQMVPHSARAADMARLAATRARDSEVRQIAKTTVTTKAPETEEMRRLLRIWGADVPDTSTSDAKVTRLEEATGARFDRMFLSMMIDSSAAAVRMGRTELAKGRNPEARALAKSIVSNGQEDLRSMRALLPS